jgi:hypothetical protein
MPEIESGMVAALFLFDVAETIRLAEVRTIGGAAARDTRLTSKLAAPVHVQYKPPPIAFGGDAIGISDIQGFATAFKVYEYGIISVALTIDFRGSWAEFLKFSAGVIGGERLEAGARQACTRLVDKIGKAAVGLRRSYLSEDYFVFGVQRLGHAIDAQHLIKEHGGDIARLLRNEPKPLSHEERDEVVRHRVSYLADDLVIITWQAAFVYDADDLQTAVEILEFANSQLLQFRYYDDLLEREMAQIYAQVETPPRWFDTLGGGRYTRAAHRLHSLFIDVNEITDRTENALKMVGDIYAARLLQLAATRLGVETWRQAVGEKLHTLDVIYRFIVEEVHMRRGHFLEIVVIVILLFELVLFLMGIMK